MWKHAECFHLQEVQNRLNLSMTEVRIVAAWECRWGGDVVETLGPGNVLYLDWVVATGAYICKTSVELCT